jgi:hypothetical protein
MNLLVKLIKDQSSLAEIINVLKRSRGCFENNWTQLEEYISNSCNLIETNDFENAFPNKKIFEQYPQSIPLNPLNKILSGKWKSQPFGIQRPPDFIGFEENKNNLHIFYMECKSGKGDRATWNCSLPIPKEHAIYLYYNKTLSNLSICSGVDLINDEEYESLKDIMPAIRKQHENINNISQNWGLYLRPMWTTLQKHPNNIEHIEKIIKIFEK